MKLDKIIAVRTGKTVYKDGGRVIKVFENGYSKADILNEALKQARIEETGLNIPKILGVQSTGCSPFVDAARDHAPLRPTAENTLADSIAVGVPRNPVKALRAVSASGGQWIAVPDEEILDAMRLLGREEGIFGEPAGVTAAAGVRRAVEQGIIRSDETVTCLCTGSGLKDVKNALRAGGSPLKCHPDLDELEKSGLFD